MIRVRAYRFAVTQAALAGGLMLVVFVSACSGESGADPAPTASTVEPAVSGAEPTATVVGAGAIPLENFHYVASLTMSGAASGGDPNKLFVSTEGDFQWPGRHAFTYTTQLGDGVLIESVVIIGEKAWYRRADDAWRQTTLDDPAVATLLDAAYSPVRPQFLSGPEFDRVRVNVLNLPSTQEFINAVRADHYLVDAEGQAFIQSFLGGSQYLSNVEDLAWDLWLATDGSWPVRLLMSGTVVGELEILERLDLQAPAAWEVRVDVSRPNDPALSIESPMAE
ncbi:MAG: hypothetical protein IH866_04365 [Chloroflexi bacterium]|nr:hypothetical protein [Chloroflexota bacterium]